MNTASPHEQKLTPREVRRLAEMGCWMMLGITPVVWWLQGPSVSTDQFVVRSSLVVLSALGAVGLRLYAWFRDSREDASNSLAGALNSESPRAEPPAMQPPHESTHAE